MKKFLPVCLALCLAAQSAFGITIQRPLVGKYSTNRVVTIVGDIDEAMTTSVSAQLRNTRSVGGPIVVDIQSPGGSVEEGRKIIRMLESEHTKLVCVVEHAAHSMAFAILTHCNVRLATLGSTMVVHKVALGGDPGVRMTAKNLRHLADDMDKEDRQMAEENRKAMHLSAADYDRYADSERRWTAFELVGMHYLDGIVAVSQ